jgi:hypothetical protein
MNMVEEWVVTSAFDKENPICFPIPLGQQLWIQPTKAIPPKAKGVKPNSNSGSTSYSMKQMLMWWAS